jgi:transposase InsO family protein
MDQRIRFVILASEPGAVMSQVCRDFGISRETGYKWLRRYRLDGPEGLGDRSRAPHQHGRALGSEIRAAVLELHEQRGWGPKKLRQQLAERRPDLRLPAASTIGDWLSKKGLTSKRRRRRSCPAHGSPLASADGPNAVWTVDFKGWFRTGDGSRCDPLTLCDVWSRYLLRCQIVGRADYEHVRVVFEGAFEEFGLPQVIRSDNGPPFASTAAAGLSPLSLWWMKHGIVVERIEPAKPQQNGRHERMHRTLKQETTKPPAATLAEQQARFDDFRQVFNNERPHEALDLQYPAALYRSSPRRYPCALRTPQYSAACSVRRVRSNGEIKWAGELIFISQVLIGELLAIEQTDTGDWRVRYGVIELGFINLVRRQLERQASPGLPKLASVLATVKDKPWRARPKRGASLTVAARAGKRDAWAGTKERAPRGAEQRNWPGKKA